MISHRLSTLCLGVTLTVMTPASFGNDLVDFLRAVNGTHHHHYNYHSPYGLRRPRLHRFHRRGFRPYRRSVSIHINRSAPIYRSRPFGAELLSPDPSAPFIGTLPHEVGEIVTCRVALESHVRIRNADEIAPGALPVIVAVRDPHLPAWDTPGCVEQLTYVQVFVPPIPLREISVSSCRTRIELDYDDWEIKIRSCNGVIEVEYDD
ncbi:MAG: hypothetical protein MK110_01210 [Fuerstiella sp.]|nr:hypothetical protein [Fuerstiella sp.]